MRKKLIFDNSKLQCDRILRFFQEEKPRLTVGEARERLGIMSLSSRISELRKRGYRVNTEFFYEYDSLGIMHRNGIYVFQGIGESNVDIKQF